MQVSILKGYRPGCIGRIAALHATYYADLVGFGVSFEAKVSRELAEFCERIDDQRDGLWLAHHADNIQASIVIDGHHADREGAHLRWFIAAPAVQGTGIGTSLLQAALDFCDQCDYRRVHLWTFQGLDAARHLYEKFGFRLVQQRQGLQWGTEVTEQQFERLV